jgi:hypothetical protein
LAFPDQETQLLELKKENTRFVMIMSPYRPHRWEHEHLSLFCNEVLSNEVAIYFYEFQIVI